MLGKLKRLSSEIIHLAADGGCGDNDEDALLVAAKAHRGFEIVYLVWREHAWKDVPIRVTK